MPILLGSDQIERGVAAEVLQLGVPRPPRRLDRRRLPQDAPGAVRRVRAAQARALLRGAAGRSGRPTSRRATQPVLLPVGGHLISTSICYEIVYPDLVRQFVARRQRAADDDHQRRVVRAARRRRISTSRRPRCARSKTAAIWSAPPTPASAASSIRTAACSPQRRSSSRRCVVGEARLLRTTHALHAHRRRLRVRVGRRRAALSCSRGDGTTGLKAQTWAAGLSRVA